MSKKSMAAFERLMAKIQGTKAAPSFSLLHPIEHIHEQFESCEAEIAYWIPECIVAPKPLKPLISFSLEIVLNEHQQLAADYAEVGKSFVLTGAAGTGKTTALREIARKLLHSEKFGTHDFKSGPGPSIAFCAFTHVATGNIRKAILKDPELKDKFSNNILTIHKLLEFEPEFYETVDEEGNPRTSMRFVPRRNRLNPLRLTHLIIEEASMVDANNLWMKLFEALLPGCQIIFVGDINQLQPIFGPSVLNYALINLPVVELTEVYRQALDSKIIYNAHRVLKGQSLESDGKDFIWEQTQPGGKLPSENLLALGLRIFLKKEYEKGLYDPNLDIILSPYNKNDLGTININKHMAQYFGDLRNAEVQEIFAGMNRLYLAVGDKVLVNKMDGVVVKIHHNAKYFGKTPRPASICMTRHGQFIPRNGEDKEHGEADEDFELDYSNVNVEDISDKEKKNEASHIVEVELEDGETVVLSNVGEFHPQVFSLGYALTVHKAQGREWRRVFIMIHKNQATLLHRELLYTAITRASQQVILFDRTNYADKAIKAQRVKGNSIEEKIEWFNSKISLEVPVPLIP